MPVLQRQGLRLHSRGGRLGPVQPDVPALPRDRANQGRGRRRRAGVALGRLSLPRRLGDFWRTPPKIPTPISHERTIEMLTRRDALRLAAGLAAASAVPAL